MLSRRIEREQNELLDDDQILGDNYEEDEKAEDMGKDVSASAKQIKLSENWQTFNESAARDQNVDDSFQEAIRKATAVRVEKLQSMMRSKHDMYHVLHAMRKFKLWSLNLSIVGIHLPDYQHCPIHFMRDIMSGHKKVSLNLSVFALGAICWWYKTSRCSSLWVTFD